MGTRYTRNTLVPDMYISNIALFLVVSFISFFAYFTAVGNSYDFLHFFCSFSGMTWSLSSHQVLQDYGDEIDMIKNNTNNNNTTPTPTPKTATNCAMMLSWGLTQSWHRSSNSSSNNNTPKTANFCAIKLSWGPPKVMRRVRRDDEDAFPRSRHLPSRAEAHKEPWTRTNQNTATHERTNKQTHKRTQRRRHETGEHCFQEKEGESQVYAGATSSWCPNTENCRCACTL